jgi:protein gp37
MVDEIGRLLPRNVALGATTIDQPEADRDAPKMAEARRQLMPLFTFCSIEPMRGPIIIPPGIFDWVIAGGESGRNARPAKPAWFRSLRDQCAATRIPFHFKQWGVWAPDERQVSALQLFQKRAAGWECDRLVMDVPTVSWGHFQADELVFNMGKHTAGRTLDGQTHDAFPDVRP